MSHTQNQAKTTCKSRQNARLTLYVSQNGNGFAICGLLYLVYFDCRESTAENKENDPFRAPVDLPPRTPRGKRPPPLGMSPPKQRPWSSAQKAPSTGAKQHVTLQTPPHMSALLTQSMDATSEFRSVPSAGRACSLGVATSAYFLEVSPGRRTLAGLMLLRCLFLFCSAAVVKSTQET